MFSLLNTHRLLVFVCADDGRRKGLASGYLLAKEP